MRIDRLKLQLNKFRLPVARGPGSMQVAWGSYESLGKFSRGDESDLLLLKRWAWIPLHPFWLFLHPSPPILLKRWCSRIFSFSGGIYPNIFSWVDEPLAERLYGSSKKKRRMKTHEKVTEGQASLARDESEGAEQGKGDINLRCGNEEIAARRYPQDEHQKKRKKIERGHRGPRDRVATSAWWRRTHP